ncbi:MAG: NAD-dependent epimerase/dehydratase family protein [Deltaproteobacteria bacterium]|nr:NAD-dependent epimerase/dehydratase family protein [Deltaproteobacteria bacterium]
MTIAVSEANLPAGRTDSDGAPPIQRRALVCGAGGFIGGHLAARLKARGQFVRTVDLKQHEFMTVPCDEPIIGDLRDPEVCARVTNGMDDVYQLAAEMGGAGYIFTGEHDAEIMRSSMLVNLHVAEASRRARVSRVFFASSACVYPAHNQADPQNPSCAEDSTYPAAPDSEYGWEKLYSERLYLSYARNYDMEVRIARFHNVFGPAGAWTGGREKVPAALCRKVAMAPDGGEIEVWGDGAQTRSFLYIDECLDGVLRLMSSEFRGPVNIGSEEMISIDGLARLTMKIAGKRLSIRHIPGPLGVRGRTSDNRLIREQLGWAPSEPLEVGLRKTYDWISARASARER